MNNLINVLKDNTTVHGELSIEEKECFDKVGKVNCEIRDEVNWTQPDGLNEFVESRTYRIKKDYNSEPEIEWCEVKPGINEPDKLFFPKGIYKFPLWKATSFTAFHQSKWADGTTSTELRRKDKNNPNGPAEYPVAVGFVKGQ